jgi:hypothetical protein
MDAVRKSWLSDIHTILDRNQDSLERCSAAQRMVDVLVYTEGSSSEAEDALAADLGRFTGQLIALLEDSAVVVPVCKLLEQCSNRSAEVTAQLMTRDNIRSVLQLLDSTDADVVCAAADLLDDLFFMPASNRDCQRLPDSDATAWLTSADGVAKLMQLLGSCNAKAASAGCYLLFKVCYDPSAARAVAAAGGVEVLVKPSMLSATCAFATCSLLTQLVKHAAAADDITVQLIEVGGIEQLARMIKEEPGITYTVSCLLSKLCKHSSFEASDVLADQIVAAGGIQLLIQTLGSSNFENVGAAMDLLALLALCSSAAAAAIAGQLTDKIRGSASGSGRDRALQTLVVILLRTLEPQLPRMADAMQTAGGVVVLAQAVEDMPAGRTSTELKDATVSALCHIASSSTTVDHVLPAAPALTRLLAAPDSSEACRAEASGALRRLAATARDKSSLLDSVEPLCNVLASAVCGPVSRARTALALGALLASTADDSRECFFRVMWLVDKLVPLLLQDGCDVVKAAAARALGYIAGSGDDNAETVEVFDARQPLEALVRSSGSRDVRAAAGWTMSVLDHEHPRTPAPRRRFGMLACSVCGVVSGFMKKCSVCKGPLYCSHSCQRMAWQAHNQRCSPAGGPVVYTCGNCA